jgi:hypothetical protein
MSGIKIEEALKNANLKYKTKDDVLVAIMQPTDKGFGDVSSIFGNSEQNSEGLGVRIHNKGEGYTISLSSGNEGMIYISAGNEIKSLFNTAQKSVNGE